MSKTRSIGLEGVSGHHRLGRKAASAPEVGQVDEAGRGCPGASSPCRDAVKVPPAHTSSPQTTWSPGRSVWRSVVVAAQPDANASPWRAPEARRRRSGAWRAWGCRCGRTRSPCGARGPPARRCSTAMGGIHRAGDGSGCWPAWMASVSRLKARGVIARRARNSTLRRGVRALQGTPPGSAAAAGLGLRLCGARTEPEGARREAPRPSTCWVSTLRSREA